MARSNHDIVVYANSRSVWVDRKYVQVMPDDSITFHVDPESAEGGPFHLAFAEEDGPYIVKRSARWDFSKGEPAEIVAQFDPGCSCAHRIIVRYAIVYQKEGRYFSVDPEFEISPRRG